MRFVAKRKSRSRKISITFLSLYKDAVDLDLSSRGKRTFYKLVFYFVKIAPLFVD